MIHALAKVRASRRQDSILNSQFFQAFAFTFCFSVCCILLSPAYCDVKIGYIDSNHILNEYRGKVALKQELETQLKSWENEAISRRQAILNEVKSFESQSSMLTPAARDRKQREIEKMQVDYENFVQKIYGPDGEAKKLNDEVMKPFIDKVNLILQKIGEERKLTIVFDAASTGIVYVKEGLDISPFVTAELNKEFAPVTVRQDKMYFWVFRFKETTSEALKHKSGTEIATNIRKAIAMIENYEEVRTAKINSAIEQVSLGKREDEFTIEEAGIVGSFAEADFVLIGEVARVGERMDVSCSLIDTKTNTLITQETASSSKAQREDINKMVNEIVVKLRNKLVD